MFGFTKKMTFTENRPVGNEIKQVEVTKTAIEWLVTFLLDININLQKISDRLGEQNNILKEK